MKFLVISDIHGETEMIEKLDPCFKKADGVIFAGDFAKFEHEETGLPVLQLLCKKHETIFAVIGNCDKADFISELESRDVCVQKTLVMHDGIAFCGSGGGSKFTGTTPNEREDRELLSDFNIITSEGKQEWNNLIAIMHNPPKDTECDKVAPAVHVGSPLLRTFIDDYKPLAVVTGHIHESFAVCKCGDTTVVNPGSLAEGKYAWLEVEKSTGGKWEVKSCTLESL
ncbi:MAG: metallophosphoesterase family protein [Treponema sp.]|nr:metallophosphoesterase family protein [Spirochaetia bacterium]MEE0892918.1 metallophosphoesterase family protein [Treponema sp.]